MKIIISCSLTLKSFWSICTFKLTSAWRSPYLVSRVFSWCLTCGAACERAESYLHFTLSSILKKKRCSLNLIAWSSYVIVDDVAYSSIHTWGDLFNYWILEYLYLLLNINTVQQTDHEQELQEKKSFFNMPSRCIRLYSLWTEVKTAETGQS